MNINLDDGVYVLAVSGGVDSMSMMHSLAQVRKKNKRLRLVVAHCNHGMRPDADGDRSFVQQKAAEYGLPFVYRSCNLGPHASEADARKVRYEFLHDVRRATRARAIITAHHQQDLLETAIINIIRGTGRKGLSSLDDGDYILRPLLQSSKEDIIAYAIKHKVDWVEDSTNIDTKYTRNHVRHVIIPRFSDSDGRQFGEYLIRAKELNQKIDAHLAAIIHSQARHDRLDRNHVIQLPFSVSLELVAAWLRHHECRDFDTKTLRRLTVACRTAAHNTSHVIRSGVEVYMHSNYQAILRKE